MQTEISVDGPVNEDNPVEQDHLLEIDHIVQKWLAHVQEVDTLRTRYASERAAFATVFSTLCETVIRPSMELVIQRLRLNGGGGVITERPADPSRKFTHRLTLWMSLSGEIVGTPRPDRYPYLQLDADADHRRVEIWEGDMWRGHGSSHSVTRWQLSEITASALFKEILEILRRSVAVASGTPDGNEVGP